MQTDPQLDASTKEIWAGVRSPASAESDIQNRISELKARISGIDAYQRFLDRSSVDSFDAYETELKSEAGDGLVDDEQIEEARDVVEAAFSSFGDFTGDSSNNTGVFGLADYDGYRTYLTDNGLDPVDADRHNTTIQTVFGPDETFRKDVVEDIADYSELEQYLIDQGFAQDDAADLVQNFKNEFSSFSEFETFVSNSDSLDELLSEFDHNEAAIQGVEYDDDGGILYLRAEKEIRFEQTNETTEDEQQVEPPDNSDIQPVLSGLAPTEVATDEYARFKATWENKGSETGEISATITADGQRLGIYPFGETKRGDTQTVRIPPGERRTASFDVRFSSPGSYTLQINDSSTSTLTVNFVVSL